MDQEAAIALIASNLRDEADIRALFLSGSHANGQADDYSDIDFLMVATPGATDAISTMWRDAVGHIDEIVLWRDRIVRPALINAVCADWTRVDVVILKPDQMGAHTRDGLKPLFDHDDIYGGLKSGVVQQPPNSAQMAYQFDEFIRILGLLDLVLGREEYLNGVAGIFHLRNLLVDLLINETDAPHRGGALHLNRLITDPQKEMLHDLPPPVPERDALIATHLAYAAAYLPRARRLAAERGINWPDRFEEVTWAKLSGAWGIERPYC